MGLFNFKKKEPILDYSKDFNNQTMNPDFNNAGLDQNQFGNPMQDSNSGLKLADLNNPNAGFGQQDQGGLDSFGNPRVPQRTETYEYNKPQQYAPQDNSKDLQLILAKLDTIKSEITNINHRLDNIERQQKEPQQKKYPW